MQAGDQTYTFLCFFAFIVCYPQIAPRDFHDDIVDKSENKQNTLSVNVPLYFLKRQIIEESLPQQFSLVL